MGKRKALGKGLSALIPDANKTESPEKGFFQCPIEEIIPNPFQPRLHFSPTELEELIHSVKEKGVITPILVSKKEKGYTLIAGERRWRAAQKAGLSTVPVVIRETTPIESLELALIENIHREDLNPIEEGLAYKRWLEDSKTTQETLAKKMGKDRSTITNLLRLLNLPQDIQKDLIEKRISMGHARVLAGLKSSIEQKKIRDIILKKDLSVRQSEEYIRKLQSGPGSKRKKRIEEDPYFISLADELKTALGTKVEIKRKGKKGTINIHYYSDGELDRLLDVLT